MALGGLDEVFFVEIGDELLQKVGILEHDLRARALLRSPWPTPDCASTSRKVVILATGTPMIWLT